MDSNHRPPDPQSGALNQLSYSCPAVPIGEAYRFNVFHLMEVDDMVGLFPVEVEKIG